MTCSADQLDHYRLRDDAWAVLFTSQNVTISVMQAAAEAGVAATGHDSLAGQRVDDPGAAGPLASAVGPGGTSGTPRFPAAVLRHPTETATQRGPFRAKDTASQSI